MSVTDGFEEFVAIAEQGSVSGAARALGVPRATLSRQLSRLESQLGVRLAHRTSRRLTLTHAGELFYARARRVLDDARAVHEDVARLDDVPRGVLRVSIPTGSHAWLSSLFASFLDRHPEVQLEVLATARMVDLVAEHVDVVVRAGSNDEGSLVGRLLARTRLVCVASPTYLSQRGTPQTAAELHKHECIGSVGEGPSSRWPTVDGVGIDVSGRFASNDLFTRVHAALEGLGIALVPESFAKGPRERGELRPILEGVVGAEGTVRVLYAERAHLPAKVRAFVDLLVGWSREHGVFDPQAR